MNWRVRGRLESVDDARASDSAASVDAVAISGVMAFSSCVVGIADGDVTDATDDFGTVDGDVTDAIDDFGTGARPTPGAMHSTMPRCILPNGLQLLTTLLTTLLLLLLLLTDSAGLSLK